MQRHDGLAGAGAALDDEHAVLRRADDLVLLALDGGDDVAERAGAATLERREQRRVAHAAPPGPVVAGRAVEALVVAETEVAVAEQFVLEAEQRCGPRPRSGVGGRAPSAAAGRAVEGLGDRRPPVDHHGLAVLVGDGETADVEALDRVGRLGRPVDAAEHQRRRRRDRDRRAA